MVSSVSVGSYSSQSLSDYLRSCTEGILIVPHYCPYGNIEISILNIIRDAYSKGYAIFFCTTFLHETALFKLLELNVFVYIKPVGGRDFGALKFVHTQISPILKMIQSDKKVLVINNSMVSLGEVNLSSKGFSFLLCSGADFAGITDSIQSKCYHMQSYHFSMSSSLFTSDLVSQFMLNFNHHSTDRNYIVKSGELAFSHQIVQSGYTTDVFSSIITSLNPSLYELLSDFVEYMRSTFPACPSSLASIDRLVQENIFSPINSNPTHWRWILSILAGHHFIKRELIEANPEDISFAPFLLPLVSFLDLDVSKSDLNFLGPRLRL